ncbi:MAG TPA: FAD-binding oxidoreductase [Mycobacteriales bacterium]|nr:FAD-binding oxidoreductase [Mycobacteriales bacterium]
MTADWTSWASERPSLTPAAQALLTEELGSLTPRRATALSDAKVPPSRLSPHLQARLAAAAGAEAVKVDDASRARHAGGQAYLDLVRRRHGDASAAPDAVVVPRDAATVQQVVEICSNERIAIVPWGGGTSVVGGLDPVLGTASAVVAIDLAQLNGLVRVDETSMLATFGPGVRTPAAEALLEPFGLTLGHVPQSFERATLGGYVVTRSAGQASTGVGRIDDLVAGLRMSTPSGELVLLPQAGSAAGPDLRRLVLGSEGTLGIVTEVTLRVHRRPQHRHYEGWMLRDWQTGLELLRRIAQEGPRPDITRLSDPKETEVSFTMSRSGGLMRSALGRYLRLRRVQEGCLLITGYEGSEADVGYRRDKVRALLRDVHAVSLGKPAGQAWEHSRFAAPALRDTLLDAGALAETLETAATWTRLPYVYDAVRAALQSTLGRAVVGCHVSHLYSSGASLYFTVLASAQGDGEIEQWSAAKAAVNDAIVAAGGTITHHHAVGTAHREHVTADLGGDLGVAMLRAVKAAVDPNNVMNPGKLLPT